MHRSTVHVSPLGSDDALWESYLDSQEADHPYHSLAVRNLIESTFRHRSRYLVARRDDAASGVLPLVEMKSAIFGRLLVSLPFVTHGGPISDDEDTARALLAAAERLGRELRVDRVEFRGGRELGSEYGDGSWELRTHKAKLTVATDVSRDQIFAGLPSRLRGKIRKAERAGAAFEVGGAELLPDFYGVFVRNMRDLGTPVYPVSLFRNFLHAFAERSAVFLVRREGEPAAGAISLRFDNTLELPWICSNYALSRHNLNEYLYWRAICRGADDPEVSHVELGRSTVESGPYRFKMQWRPRIEPLPWRFKPIGSEEVKTDADSPRYRAARSLWRKLPLAMTRIAGPPIVRNIP